MRRILVSVAAPAARGLGRVRLEQLQLRRLRRSAGQRRHAPGGIPDNPDHLDTGLSYAVEGWELLEATNNGLLTFKKAAAASSR